MAVLLQLHFFMVPLILLAAAVTLIAGIWLLVLRWKLSNEDRPTTGPIPLLTQAFRILLWVTAGLGVLQPVIGALIYLAGGRPEDQLHFVYGGIVLLAIPIAYVYSDQKRVRRDLIIMNIAVVLVIGAAVRALMTGGAIPH